MLRANKQTERLIYDVGMHKGEDTAFYLRRGYRVIGVEANPVLLPFLHNRFSFDIANGRLQIIGKAIAPQAGKVKFAIYYEAPHWSSMAKELIDRNAAVNLVPKIIEVEAVTFAELLEQHEMPYYLKVDIEGMDWACVSALKQFENCPQFVSIESPKSRPSRRRTSRNGRPEPSLRIDIRLELQDYSIRHFGERARALEL